MSVFRSATNCYPQLEFQLHYTENQFIESKYCTRNNTLQWTFFLGIVIVQVKAKFVLFALPQVPVHITSLHD